MGKKIRIGLSGNYGHKELCDDLIEIAIKEAFEKVMQVEWVRIGKYAKNPYRGNYEIFDLVILGGGSLLGLPFPQLVKGLKRSSCPFLIFGTGFRKAIKKKDLKYLWERASIISVRGKVSVERLEKLVDTSKVTALGDPIFLLETTKIEKEDYIGGVIRPHNTDLSWMNHVLTFLKKKRTQDVKLFSFCDAQGDLVGNKLGYTTRSCHGLEDAYLSVAKSSFWIGNRLHTFTIALMNAIPSIGIEIEFRKIEDVCSTLGYPYWINANAPLAEFEHKYFDLMRKWKKVNVNLQQKIRTVKYDLRNVVERILYSI